MYVYSRRTGLYCGKFRSYRTQYLGFCFLVWLVIVQAKAVKWSLGWWGPEGLDSYREVCRTGPILCSHPSLFLISDLLPHLSFIFSLRSSHQPFTEAYVQVFVSQGFLLPDTLPPNEAMLSYSPASLHPEQDGSKAELHILKVSDTINLCMREFPRNSLTLTITAL